MIWFKIDMKIYLIKEHCIWSSQQRIMSVEVQWWKTRLPVSSCSQDIAYEYTIIIHMYIYRIYVFLIAVVLLGHLSFRMWFEASRIKCTTTFFLTTMQTYILVTLLLRVVTV